MANIFDNSGGDLLDDHGRPILDEHQDPRSADADYADTLMALLPSGRVWPREPSSTLARIISALAPTLSRIEQRARYLLTDSPAGPSLIETLPEWESTLGLPDECAGPQATVGLRQLAVQAKLAARGGQSIPYYVGIAARLGVSITIAEYQPLRFNRRSFNKLRFDGPEMAHVWRVTAPATRFVPFVFGIGQFGDPFGSYGSMLLECTLNRIKPAQTILQFSYV